MKRYFLGLISGTSVDGVDACLACFDEQRCVIEAARTTPYPAALRQRVTDLIKNPHASLEALGATHVAIGRFFARCALEIIDSAGIRRDQVTAIGHHGQTVFHQPDSSEPFTLQLGDPNSIAALTGIDTVADLRGLDVACGGQGAPMVPAFHEWLFASPTETRVVLNIGGIANITVIDPGAATLGFDTGPGNTLLDIWIDRRRGRAYDERGAWSATGRVDEGLLKRLLSEPYFERPYPKSTGRELFNAAWLDARLGTGTDIADEDVQCTLAELTAVTISDAIQALAHPAERIIVCGGGAYNDDLMARLRRLNHCPVESSETYGPAPDWIEAAAFAWLAAARVDGRPGNVPTVTGARQAVVLGGLYCGVNQETNP